ncbi:MAG: glycoside hydrolase family 32 protein [Prolixibacteraceae bacterium]|nr:glycoside hydrolase family 32 protein [Prolixibacteraceae bacterium]
MMMENKLKIYFFLFLPLILISSKPDKGYYNELYRPQFHFTPEKNWHNDPNGLVFYKGEYHLFYQYNPNGKEWGYMHWGHAVSTDLVHWQHLPIAIYPDNNSEDKELCTAFSGSAIVDEDNLLGKQTGDENTLVAFYTSFKCGQRIAYSTDRGRTWEKFEGNPVIPYNEEDDARDPKVFRYEKSGKWVMVLWRKPEGNERQQGVSIYVSENLVDWEFKSHVPGFFECPDLVELPVNNRMEDTKWVLFDGDGSYLIGGFDGEMFLPETGKMKSDYGKNYYATQTWSNIPEEDGRTLQIAWMKGGEFPDMPFQGQMTFPSELSLTRTGNIIKLVRNPVSEIELLHGKDDHWENRNIIPGINDNILKKLKGDCFQIKGTFDLKTCNNFGFMLRHGKKTPGIEVNYNVDRGVLSCMGQIAPLNPVNGKIQMEILLDRSSVEIYANNGQVVMSFVVASPEENDSMELFTHGGELLVEKLDIYEINSVWREK